MCAQAAVALHRTFCKKQAATLGESHICDWCRSTLAGIEVGRSDFQHGRTRNAAASRVKFDRPNFVCAGAGVVDEVFIPQAVVETSIVRFYCPRSIAQSCPATVTVPWCSMVVEVDDRAAHVKAIDATVTKVGHEELFMITVIGNRAKLSGLNIVGLKRRGFSREEIHDLRKAYRLIFALEGTLADRLDDVAEDFAQNEPVMEIVNFIRADSTRAICQPALEDAA